MPTLRRLALAALAAACLVPASPAVALPGEKLADVEARFEDHEVFEPMLTDEVAKFGSADSPTWTADKKEEDTYKYILRDDKGRVVWDGVSIVSDGSRLPPFTRRNGEMLRLLRDAFTPQLAGQLTKASVAFAYKVPQESGGVFVGESWAFVIHNYDEEATVRLFPKAQALALVAALKKKHGKGEVADDSAF